MQQPTKPEFVDVNEPGDLLDRFRKTLSIWGCDLTRSGILIVGCVVVGGLVGMAALFFTGKSPSSERLSLPPPVSNNTSTTVADIAIYAAGAVERPGVYEVQTGARVTDAIAAAGGLLPEADATTINLAALLNDGERIYVPRLGETPPPELVIGGDDPTSSAESKGRIINLNTASAEQLDALPGVGPSTAKAIVDYRGKHGRFRSIEELIEVRGIGDAKMQELRSRVSV